MVRHLVSTVFAEKVTVTMQLAFMVLLIIKYQYTFVWMLLNSIAESPTI